MSPRDHIVDTSRRRWIMFLRHVLQFSFCLVAAHICVWLAMMGLRDTVQMLAAVISESPFTPIGYVAFVSVVFVLLRTFVRGTLRHTPWHSDFFAVIPIMILTGGLYIVTAPVFRHLGLIGDDSQMRIMPLALASVAAVIVTLGVSRVWSGFRNSSTS